MRNPLCRIEITRRTSIIPEERHHSSPLLRSRAYHYFSPPTGCGGYFECHGGPVEEAEVSYYSDVHIQFREVPIAYIQSHKSHERKMVNSQSKIKLNKLEILLAIRTHKRYYIQIFSHS